MKALLITIIAHMTFFAALVMAQVPQISINYRGEGSGCGGEVYLHCSDGSVDSFWCGHPFEVDLRNETYGVSFSGLSGSISSLGNTFVIDTVAHLIRNFTIQDRSGVASCSDKPSPGSSGEQYTVILDSMPYIGIAGNQITVNDSSVNADYRWSSSFSSGNGCFGGTQCESSVNFQMHFTIDFASNAVAVPPANLSDGFSVVVNQGILFAKFSPVSYHRQFFLYDLLGSEVFQTSVAESSTHAEVPIDNLLTGCYFARLGDAVAKFIVPPR